MKSNEPEHLESVRDAAVVEERGHWRRESALLGFADDEGRWCEVYAERCLPVEGHYAGILHCVGGGQTVNRADLLDWADKGFAVVSFDWQIGTYPAHDPAKKSRWPAGVVHQDHYITSPSEAILPLAVRAAGACIDWLVQADSVDAERIGVAGISWGGYLAWLVGAYEPRVKAVVPVYGCGGQFDPRYPGHGIRLPEAVAEVWRRQWDPFSIAELQSRPVAYLSSCNDFFGILPLADELLNRLSVPRRRSWLPNADHCLGPEESALGLAWLRHYLDDGPALPAEPLLTESFRIEADAAAEVDHMETWWTPTLRDGNLGCWIRGRPGPEAAAAYGRVHYKGGFCLCSPLRWQEPRPASPLPARYPDLRDGLGWSWSMGSTQFHGNQVAMESLGKGRIRLCRDPSARDEEPGFHLNTFAHPGWNNGDAKGFVLQLRAETEEPLSAADVTVLLRGAGKTEEISARLPLINERIRITRDAFPGFPAMMTLRSIQRITIRLHSRARAWVIGPLERV